MKHLFLAVIATGLIFATGCKKNEDVIANTGNSSFPNHSWTLIEKNCKTNGIVGDLYQTPTNQFVMLTRIEQNVRAVTYTGILTVTEDGYTCPDATKNQDCLNGAYDGNPIIFVRPEK